MYTTRTGTRCEAHLFREGVPQVVRLSIAELVGGQILAQAALQCALADEALQHANDGRTLRVKRTK